MIDVKGLITMSSFSRAFLYVERLHNNPGYGRCGGLVIVAIL
jgi:hypothetical protein